MTPGNAVTIGVDDDAKEPPSPKPCTATADERYWFTIVTVRDGVAIPVTRLFGEPRCILYPSHDTESAKSDAIQASEAIGEPVWVIRFHLKDVEIVDQSAGGSLGHEK